MLDITELKKIGEGVDCCCYKQGNKVFKAYRQGGTCFCDGSKSKVYRIWKNSNKAAICGLGPAILSTLIRWTTKRETRYRGHRIIRRGWGFWTEYAKPVNNTKSDAVYYFGFDKMLQEELEIEFGEFEDLHNGNLGLLDDSLVCIDFGEFGWQ